MRLDRPLIAYDQPTFVVALIRKFINTRVANIDIVITNAVFAMLPCFASITRYITELTNLARIPIAFRCKL